MVELIFAGARSIFGLSDMKKAFSSQNLQVSFADAPFMKDVLFHDYKETEKILFTASLPEESLVIPLSEYWISRCIKDKNCRISEKALKSSRSKEYFYRLLKENGCDFPEIYETLENAEKALDSGKRIIVKPVGLHSGYGVEVIDGNKKDLLSEYIRQAAGIKNKTLRLMEIENEGVMLTEAVEGTEYSADCFFYEGTIVPVRICRKKILVINDKPCTAYYELLNEESDDFKIYAEKLTEWMKMLFDEKNISFGQFDFIDDGKGRIVPIDFASRVGGGICDLLMETGLNPYAESISRALELKKNGKKEILKLPELAQYNYLPKVSGYVINDEYPLIEGKQKIFKKKGDYVISNPSSVGSRVALVVGKIIPGFDPEKLILGEDFFEVKGRE